MRLTSLSKSVFANSIENMFVNVQMQNSMEIQMSLGKLSQSWNLTDVFIIFQETWYFTNVFLSIFKGFCKVASIVGNF